MHQVYGLCPLNEDLAIRFLTLYRKVLLEQKDTYGNQILTPEQADSIISLWDAGDIKAHYTEDAVVLDVYADVATRPYRTYYPVDIENFRNEYLQTLELEAQSWQKDTVDYIRSKFDSMYTDDVIMSLLKKGCTPSYAITKDLMTY